MSWKEELREASFRGVPMFVVLKIRRSGGRRGPTHEYPQSDIPFSQDTGRKAKRFSVEGVIHGDNYGPDLKRLEEAFDEKGPGLYVDPWRGEISVQVRDYSFGEAVETGGTVPFTVEFVEAGRDRHPTATVDTAAVLSGASDSVASAASVRFEEVFSTNSVPEFLRNEARLTAAGQIDLARGLGGGLTPLDDLSASFNRALGEAGDLISSALPADIVTAARSVADTVGSVLPIGRARVLSFLQLRNLGDIDLAEQVLAAASTPTLARGAANRLVQLEFYRDLSLSRAAAALIGWDFDSMDEASAAQAAVVSALDGALVQTGRAAPVLADPGRQASHQALRALRSAVVRDVSARSGGLARIVRQEIPETVSASVLAYRLYGDASRAAEVVARNGIAHPGFVPSGTELELLSG